MLRLSFVIRFDKAVSKSNVQISQTEFYFGTRSILGRFKIFLRLDARKPYNILHRKASFPLETASFIFRFCKYLVIA